MDLKSIRTWMYQIQDFDVDGAVESLAASDYPLLVLEPGHNFSESPYDTKAIVTALRFAPNGKRRILLAYIDIGQAEDYRNYWGDDWARPTEKSRGRPDFILTVDPDGWSGNYPAAYWREEWKELWLGKSGIIAELAELGFDGVYLDWVEGYDDDHVRRAADIESVSPEEEMIKFVEEIGEAGRRIRPQFLVVVQNAPYLIDFDPAKYAAAIDGAAMEDTWFHGQGDADWDDPEAGDLRSRHDYEWSTESRLKQYKKYQDLGIPVFTVDYCLKTENAAYVYEKARQAGLIPLVTRVSLSRMTETPPDKY